MNRRIIGALMTLPVALVGLVVSATPAYATQPKTDKCKIVTHKSGESFYTVGAGVSEATDDGLYLDTPGPETTAKAGWKTPVANASLASFESLRYETYQIAGAPHVETVAAIKLTLNNGLSAVMEPLYGDGGPGRVHNKEWQSWNALANAQRWWVTNDPSTAQHEPDIYLTWTALIAKYPAVRVTEVRIEQGSWNHGTESLVRNLKVDIKGKDCHNHNWKAPSLKVKPGVEFQSTCSGLTIKIYPGDTKRRWKVVAADFIYIETVSDTTLVVVPKSKAKTGTKVFMKVKGAWKLVAARTWTKSDECDVPSTTPPVTTPPATPPPTTQPPATPPVTPPATTPPVTLPPTTPDGIDTDPNTSSPAAQDRVSDEMPVTGDKVPLGLIVGFGIIALGAGIALFILGRQRRREI